MPTKVREIFSIALNSAMHSSPSTSAHSVCSLYLLTLLTLARDRPAHRGNEGDDENGTGDIAASKLGTLVT